MLVPVRSGKSSINGYFGALRDLFGNISGDGATIKLPINPTAVYAAAWRHSRGVWIFQKLLPEYDVDGKTPALLGLFFLFTCYFAEVVTCHISPMSKEAHLFLL